MKNAELYHLRSNPKVMVPRVFLSASEMPHMMPSSVRIVRTLEREFKEICLQLAQSEAKVVIQEIPNETHWKIHVIQDGMVGTSTTLQRTLVDAVREAWSQHRAAASGKTPAKVPAEVC